MECIALAFGPFISGVIAHYSTWRLCFYITIPIGVLIIALIFFGVGPLRRSGNTNINGKMGLKRIDWTGFAINVPMTLCLVLGLQWAGTAYPWANWRIVLLLVVAALLLTIFLIVEFRAGDEGMVPLKMLRQRSVAIASLINFCNFAHLAVLGYYVSCYLSFSASKVKF